MANVIVYSSPTCPYCWRAIALLESKSVEFEIINVAGQPDKRQEMQEKSGRHTVPQIFIHGQAIGGCDELHALEASGQLNQLLTRGF